MQEPTTDFVPTTFKVGRFYQYNGLRCKCVHAAVGGHLPSGGWVILRVEQRIKGDKGGVHPHPIEYTLPGGYAEHEVAELAE